MTVDEAIEVQEKRLASPFVRANADTMEATRLGVEALKRERDRRPMGHPDPADLLPGETQK